MDAKMKKMLEELAARKCWSDSEEFDPYSSSGGNFDDAYYGGVSDGEAFLARELLKMLG